MSILLEALKKSEQQRQLGQIPTLQTGIEGQGHPELTLNHWIPLSLIALSAGVMIWFGWLQFRDPDSGSVPAVAATVTQSAVEQQPRTLTESFQSSGEDLSTAAVPPSPAPQETEDDRARLAQSFNDFKKPGDDTDTAASSNKQAAESEQPSTPLAEPEATATPLAEPEATVTQSGQPKVERGQSKLAPHIAEPISYWELPQGVRDNIPEIKITVLVYAEKPDDRFLLTNGQRMAEKDEMQSGVVLDEIRRDGAIFLYRKYRFLVKS
jgi:general secretion pathway protein B